MNFESFSFSESPRHTCMAEAKIQDAETAQKEKPRFTILWELQYFHPCKYTCRLNLYNIQPNHYFLLGFWCKWQRCKARLGFDSDFTDMSHTIWIVQCTLMISQSVCHLIWMYPNYITLIVLKFLGENMSAPPETKSH